MKAGGVYSIKLERLSAERQQSVIRLLLSATTSLLLLKFHIDQGPDPVEQIISLDQIIVLTTIFLVYSALVWSILKWRPELLRETMLASSIIEIILITFLIRQTAGIDIPFYLWYLFYVVSVSTRYGRQLSILALAACIVSFVWVVCLAPQSYAVNVPAVLGFTSFLLVLAFMFGQISERQINYQASLAVVNEFRAELAGLATSAEIIGHLLIRAKQLLNAEQAWFLPAQRGSDGSEAVGLRSSGADPVLLSTFREGGGVWNVEEVLKEQRPIISNNLIKDSSLSREISAKLNLRHLAASPMMVRSIPVGVVYVANRKDKPLMSSDLQLLELMATQAAPVVENALLWERLREAAASEERLRIARDLHDNFLQTLAAIKLHLERCKLLIQKDTTRALEGIDKIHQIATRGLAEVRSYLSELRLMGPEPSRFKQAIERCSAEAASKAGFKVHLDLHPPEEAMPPNVALAAFQIVRELLNNAAAHSGAEHVEVRVYSQDGKLYLEVEDDGKGFEVARVRAEKASEGHLGLVGVDERARQSHGSFKIASEPEKGTLATAVLTI
ncbi:MAG: GAF domain-containing sensor histidine kinase [Armatimonadota bacterium]|nr:sensor histidine kinase [bacterium]